MRVYSLFYFRKSQYIQAVDFFIIICYAVQVG